MKELENMTNAQFAYIADFNTCLADNLKEDMPETSKDIKLASLIIKELIDRLEKLEQ